VRIHSGFIYLWSFAFTVFSTHMRELTMWPNTALEPTAAAPLFDSLQQIHACGFPRRGSALDR
jgi:hypothetical protein